jgi:hypothetical protein
LKNKYEYFVIFDDETLFVKNIDLRKMCDEYFENKILYGNKTFSEISKSINYTTFKQLIKSQYNTIQYNTIQYNELLDNLYLWWNNLSIFKKENLDDFFGKINYNEKTLQNWK